MKKVGNFVFAVLFKTDKGNFCEKQNNQNMYHGSCQYLCMEINNAQTYLFLNRI